MPRGISFGGSVKIFADASAVFATLRKEHTEGIMFKKGSKIFAAVVVTLLIAVLAATFVGCGKIKDLAKPVIETGDKEATVIIGEDSYFVKTDAVYVHDLLVQLKEAQKITYEFDETQYGAFIKKLNKLEGTADYSKWIGVYVDVDSADIITPGYDVTVDGKTYHSASLGVSSLPVRNGTTYLFAQN